MSFFCCVDVFDADLSLTRYPVPNVTTQIARVCTRV